MAITLTVSSTLINVTSTGGVEETFDAVVTQANTISAGCITGAGTSGDPYIVVGDRELRFAANTIVKFVQDTNLKWNSITTSGRNALHFQYNSYGTIEDGCVFDVDASSSATIYFIWYGAVNVVGTSGNLVHFIGVSRHYCYFNTADCDWEYFAIDNVPSSGYALYFSQYSSIMAPNISFKNFEVNNLTGGYGITFTQGGMYANVTLQDFTIDGGAYGLVLYGSSFKIKNCVITNTTSHCILAYGVGNVVSAAYETAQDDTTFPTGRFQSMGVLENVEMSAPTTSTYGILAYYNSLLYLKNCTFNGNRGVGSAYGSVVIHNNTTFNSCTIDKLWGNNGTHLHGREYPVLVQDTDSNPIENATVSVVQSSSPAKERWFGMTNADGELVNVFGDPLVLIEKEETSLGTYADWSDDEAGGLYHILTASHPDYALHKETMEVASVASGTTITVTLYPPVKFKVFNGATLDEYPSNIKLIT